MKRFCLLTASLLTLLASTPVFAAKGEMDGIVKFFFEQGEKAYKEKHFADAFGWFERADAAAERFNGKDDKICGTCKEWLGRSLYEQKEYNKALNFLITAEERFKQENSGAASPSTARIDDLRGDIYCRLGKLPEAELTLVSAWLESLGDENRDIPEPFAVPYRTERVAQFCRSNGGLSVNVQFQGAMNIGRSSDDIYEKTIKSLAARLNRNQNGVKPSLEKVFQLWKNQNDHGGNEFNAMNYQRCWSQVYGAPKTSPTSSYEPPSKSWSPNSGGGGLILLDPNSGSSLKPIEPSQNNPWDSPFTVPSKPESGPSRPSPFREPK